MPDELTPNEQPTPQPAPSPATVAAVVAKPAPPAEPAAPPAADPDPAPRETDWKAEARKWEARAKANRGAVTELDELRTTHQTVVDRLAAIEAEQAEKALEQARAQAAQDAGLPAAYAARLTGTTADELAADAKQVATMFTLPPNPKQGHTPTPPQSDPELQMVRALFRGEITND
jgi:hypothetical protein